MNRLDNATIAHNMKWGLILIGALVLSLLIGTMLVTDTETGLKLFFLVVFPLSWLMIGSRYWWFPIPLSICIGGVFQFGFKIMPHEIATAMALAALGIAIPLRWREMLQQRPPLAPSIILLCGYLLLHWAGSLAYNQYMDVGGAGNVTRTYSYALWPIILIICFHYFGKTSQIPTVLKWMFAILLARILIGYVAMVTGITIRIPVINYIPAPFMRVSMLENADFRFTGPLFAIVSMMLCLTGKRPESKLFFFICFLFGSMTLFLGGGRSYMVAFLLFPVLICLLYRRYGLLFGAFTFGLVVLGALNAYPSILDQLPGVSGRTLSILVLNDDHGWSADAEGSNTFHHDLTSIASERWKSSANTILLGTGIRPFDKTLEGEGYIDPQEQYWGSLNAAANTGAYEAGLWTVLAVTGIVGYLLYLNAFRSLLVFNHGSLRRERISNAGHAFAFIGFYLTIAWYLLSWRYGHFPSDALFFAYLGYAWILDEREKARQEIAETLKARQSGWTSGAGPDGTPQYGNPAYS